MGSRQPDVTIPHRFTPRLYQGRIWNCLNKGFRRAIGIWHRRAGKDKTLFNLMVKEAVKTVGVYYYFFPTFAQGKKVLWDGIDGDGMKFTDHAPEELVEKKNDTEMKITLVTGSIIQVIGTDNYNFIRGTNPRGTVWSEFSYQDPAAWDVMRPILAENQGWAIFNYTPHGPNHGQELYEMARSNPEEWFSEILTVSQTKRPNGLPVISEEAIEAERKAGMSDEMIEQEFRCSFTAAVLGSYFGKEIKRARNEGRITEIQIDPSIPVSTYWDLGVGDSTSIWFGQDLGENILFVDYYEAFDVGLDHYVDVLKQKEAEHGWHYGLHVGPHDLAVREWGKGASRIETAWREYQLRFQVAERPLKKQDSIEAARRVLRRCIFDYKRCERGIKALELYRKNWDEKKRAFSPMPLRDWTTHAADAFQTYALWVAKGIVSLETTGSANTQTVVNGMFGG